VHGIVGADVWLSDDETQAILQVYLSKPEWLVAKYAIKGNLVSRRLCSEFRLSQVCLNLEDCVKAASRASSGPAHGVHVMIFIYQSISCYIPRIWTLNRIIVRHYLQYHRRLSANKNSHGGSPAPPPYTHSPAPDLAAVSAPSSRNYIPGIESPTSIYTSVAPNEFYVSGAQYFAIQPVAGPPPSTIIQHRL